MNNKKSLTLTLLTTLLLTTACDKKEDSQLENKSKAAFEDAKKVATENTAYGDDSNNDDGHSWEGWTQLGTQTIDGWVVKGMQFGKLEEEEELEASVEIEITPPKGMAQASAVRAWMGGKDSDSLKEKLSGHSHGGDTIAYFFGTELESLEQRKFMVQIETQDGKQFFAEFELQ